MDSRNLPPEALTSHYNNFPEPVLHPTPMFLHPGNQYNIKMGYASVKKELPFFNFDAPDIEPEIVGAALIDYIKNIHCDSLSACQLGFSFKALAFRTHDDKFAVCFNPVVVWESPETAIATEYDPSFPDASVKIKRPYKVRARYRDMSGVVHTKTFEGALARFFQHEYDRNEGRIFWMAADTYHRAKAIKNWKATQRKLEKWQKNQRQSR